MKPLFIHAILVNQGIQIAVAWLFEDWVPNCLENCLCSYSRFSEDKTWCTQGDAECTMGAQCFCEDWDESICTSSACDMNPCMNGGICEESHDSFVCTCPAWWTGQQCETAVAGICDSDPCMHSGTCVMVDIDTFNCNCLASYSGELCEFWVDPCKGQDCWGGGYCQAINDGFVCVCPDDYAGNTCRLGKLYRARIILSAMAPPQSQIFVVLHGATVMNSIAEMHPRFNNATQETNVIDGDVYADKYIGSIHSVDFIIGSNTSLQFHQVLIEDAFSNQQWHFYCTDRCLLSLTFPLLHLQDGHALHNTVNRRYTIRRDMRPSAVDASLELLSSCDTVSCLSACSEHPGDCTAVHMREADCACELLVTGLPFPSHKLVDAVGWNSFMLDRYGQK